MEFGFNEEQRQLVDDAPQLGRPTVIVGIEQRDPEDYRCFKGEAEPHAWIAALDFPDRGPVGAYAVAELLSRPATLMASEPHPSSEQPCRLGRIQVSNADRAA